MVAGLSGAIPRFPSVKNSRKFLFAEFKLALIEGVTIPGVHCVSVYHNVSGVHDDLYNYYLCLYIYKRQTLNSHIRIYDLVSHVAAHVSLCLCVYRSNIIGKVQSLKLLRRMYV
jgi:hypothetical protein